LYLGEFTYSRIERERNRGTPEDFLSYCHRFSHSYFADEKTPFCENPGNSPMLLYLGKQRDCHGPINCYCEGTNKQVIQKLEKVLKLMRKNTEYFTRELIFVHQSDVLKWYKNKIQVRVHNNSCKEKSQEKKI
jgi:hypothetical protein